MAINQFPGRRGNKVNVPHSCRDGGINNQKTPGRRSEPRVAGEPPSPMIEGGAFKRHFGDGHHGKVNVPKSTRHGYGRAAHHHDYFTKREK